jgi:hypothetical protein
MNTGKKVLFGVLGFFVGIAVLTVVTAGGSVTTAGFLTVLALSGDPSAVPAMEDTGTLEEETARFLSSFEFGSRIKLSEDALSRLAAAAIIDAGRDHTDTGYFEPGRFELLSLRAETEPGRLRFESAFTVTPEMPDAGAWTMQPFSTTASVEFTVDPAEEAVVLEPIRLKVGRLRFPVRFPSRWIVPPPLPGEELRYDRGKIIIPYSIINEEMPKFVSLTGIRPVSDGIVLTLSVDSQAGKQVLQHFTPLIESYVPALEASMSEVLREAVTDEEVRKVLASLERVSASGGAASTERPPEPSALLSYLENEVTVEYDGGRFEPQIGEDLFGGSTIQTGPDSLAELILRDESVVKIAENTGFVLEKLPQSTDDSSIFNLMEGSVRAKVTKMISSDSSFSVRAESAVLGVRGTDLYILLEEDEPLLIRVIEGKVAFVPVSGPETVVEADRGVSIPPEALTKPVTESFGTEPIPEKEKVRIEEEMQITTNPADEQALRAQAAVLDLIDTAREIASLIIALDGETQEKLARDIQRRIDFEELERRVAEILEALGLESLDFGDFNL